MWLEMVGAIQGAMEDLRMLGQTRVPRHLAPWVRQAAEARGMRVQTTPLWGDRVRIEVVEADTHAATRS